MTRRRIFTTSVASVYPHDVAKAQKKGRTQAEVAEIILWLTGYTAEAFADCLAKKTDLETFFGEAPAMNPARAEIKGVICGCGSKRSKTRPCGRSATWISSWTS